MAGADGRRSGLSFFGESLARALEGEEDTELFDSGLLERISKLGKVFGSGIDSFELCTEEPRGVKKVEVAPARIESVDLLIRKTPPPQQVRVAGTLNMIRHSDKMFSLTLESGEALKGVAEGASAEHLATLFGQPVMVSGEAVFRPSGSLLRIEASHLRPATGDEGFWSVVPRPGLGALEPVATRKEQGPRSGINAIWGKWPGEESEEQIDEALAAIS